MAATEHQPSARYARENWWGEDLDGNDDQDSTAEHDPLSGTSREDWIAHKILKDTAPALLCPIALSADPDEDFALHTHNHEVEISEPELYVPASIVETDEGPRPMYGDHRRQRYNPEYGYICGPHIKDRPTGEFLDVVWMVLERQDLPDRLADRILTLAETRKQMSDVDNGKRSSDVAIMAEVIQAIEHPAPYEYLEGEGF